MKKNKNKILAVILVVAVIVSAFVIGTVANAKESTVTISVDKTELSAGQTATVTVKATTNYPVATLSIPVFYDKTKVEISNATATMTSYAQANTTTDTNAVDNDRIYSQTTVDSSNYGFVLVNYIGGANESVPASLQNETVLTFTITAKTNVSGEAAVLCVSDSAKTESNSAGMLYFGTTTSGTTITSIPENVEGINVDSANASVIISNGNAQIVAKADTDTVIDDTNKYIYGITPNTNIENYFQVNNGSYELIPSSAGATNGTGAQIKVKNAQGTVIDTYTVIIFGDVNGDGMVDTTDQAYLNAYNMGDVENIIGVSTVTLIAADITDGLGENNVDTTDQAYLIAYNIGDTIAISINPYA